MSARGVALCAAVVGFALTPPAWADTVALYHLDEVSGTVAIDIAGGHTLVQALDQPTEGKPAQTGFGTCFGGWTWWDAAYTNTTFPNLAGNWTIEFFFNTLADTNGDSNPVEFGAGPSDRFRFAPNQGHAFEYRTNDFLLTTGYLDYDANWHHVALTYEAAVSKFRLYYDGVLRDAKIGSVATTTFLSIGCANYGQEVYTGRVDELRVSDTLVYLEDFTPPTAPFGTSTGACCLPDETCTVTSQTDCVGQWLGEGTGCDPNPCTGGPQGACCHSDGSCTLTAEAGCAGTWQGTGTTCDPNPCPQPTGACCLANGSCTVTTLDDCAGTWQGQATTCEPNPCPQPLVALFHLDEPYGAVAFDAAGGYPLTQLADEDTERKPAQPGFGSCVGGWYTYAAAYQTELFLDLSGGDWTIEFFVNTLSDTNGDSCPVSFGASSQHRFRWTPDQDHGLEYRTPNYVLSSGYVEYDDGWHHVALTQRGADHLVTLYWDGVARASTSAGGADETTYLAVGCTYEGNELYRGLVDELRVSRVLVYTADFPPPTAPFQAPGAGACCLPDGWCLVLQPPDCASIWLGEGTDCAANPCTVPIGACCQPDGSCTVTAAFECQGTWLGTGTGCDPNMCLGVPFITGVGDLPGGDWMSEACGISSDGHVVVGRSSSAPGDYEAFRWTIEEGITGLGFLPGATTLRSNARAASSDGSVIVGWSKSANTVEDSATEAYRWAPDTGMVALGDLPGAAYDSDAWGVSDDGEVVAGVSRCDYYGRQAFHWTAETGMVGLGNLSGDPYFSEARAVSADGAVVVGYSDYSWDCPWLAFQWTAADGMTSLGDLPGGSCLSIARGVSGDGSAVVGTAWSASGNEAFRWTPATGMQSVGDLPGGYMYSEAWDVSADGSVVVGLGSAAAGARAFIWDGAHGMRDLRSVLESEYGLDLSGWMLQQAQAISADGRTIAGIGINPLGYTEGWVADLGRIRHGDLNCDGVIGFGDINPFVLALSNPVAYRATYPDCPPLNGDCNGDHSVDFGDINPFVALLTGG